MKNVLPLLASALLIAGCSDDKYSSPWSTEKDAATEAAIVAQTPSAKTEYSWQKKAAEAKAAQPVQLEAGKALVTSIRGDAGLIEFKRAEASAPGDKLVLKKDGKSLLVVVVSVAGESVIANIAPKQINTPAITTGDDVAVAAFEEAAAPAAAPVAAK